jgi:hypothetical protein
LQLIKMLFKYHLPGCAAQFSKLQCNASNAGVLPYTAGAETTQCNTHSCCRQSKQLQLNSTQAAGSDGAVQQQVQKHAAGAVQKGQKHHCATSNAAAAHQHASCEYTNALVLVGVYWSGANNVM